MARLEGKIGAALEPSCPQVKVEFSYFATFLRLFFMGLPFAMGFLDNGTVVRYGTARKIIQGVEFQQNININFSLNDIIFLTLSYTNPEICSKLLPTC